MQCKIEAAMVKANCQSRNEFLEHELQFCCGYLALEDMSEFLPPTILHALRGIIQCRENCISVCKGAGVNRHTAAKHDELIREMVGLV